LSEKNAISAPAISAVDINKITIAPDANHIPSPELIERKIIKGDIL
jgi:hypothetical protein